MNPRPRIHRGFTLIEVLVAFTVLGLLLGAALRIFGSGLGAIARDGDYAHAVVLAQSQLATIESSPETPRDGDQGTFDERFGWRLRLAPWEPQEPGRRVARVTPALATLDVYWTDGGSERSVRLDTLLLVPR